MYNQVLKFYLFPIVLICSVFLFFACSNILRVNKTDAKNHYVQGIKQLTLGQKEQAIRSFRSATLNYKKFSEAYFELAKIYLKENTIDARIQADWALQNAVRYRPDNIEYRLALAKLNLKRELFSSAENQFKQIIRRDSSHAEVWFSLGFIHEVELLHLQNLITPDSSGVTIHFTDFAKEELKKTLNFYNRSRKANPAYLPAYYRLSFIYYELQNWQKMITTLQQALNFNSEDKNCYLYLALAFHRNNQYESAYKNYQMAWKKMEEAEQNFYSSIEPLLSTKAGKAFINKTDSEKIKFTNLFWQSKDPMFLTDFNERLMEHFARIAYANLRFGFPHKNIEGWQTDRGKVYIRFGPPFRQMRTTASLRKTSPGNRNPLISSKETWNYPDFQFVFEDRFLNRNYQFKWGLGADDDYLDIFNQAIKKVPELYKPDFGGGIFDLPVITRQFDSTDSLKTIYIFSGIPIESVNRRNYTIQNRMEADLQKGLFVFDDSWSPVVKNKKNVTLQFSPDSKFQNRFFLSVDSLKLAPNSYNFAIEFFDAQGKNLVRFLDTLQIINPEKSKINISDIILANDIRLKTSITKINRTRIDITPNFDFSFGIGQDLFIYYEIYNLNKNQTGRTNYQISHIIRRLDPKGSLVSNLFTNLKLQKKNLPEVTTTFNYEGDKTHENHFRIIQLKNYEPGKYQLVVRVTDLNSNHTMEKFINFKIKE